MKLNHKDIHIYSIFMQSINLQHQPFDPHLSFNVGLNLSMFWDMLLHKNENRWWNNHFWIFACGGNQHQWTNVSFPAEVGKPAILGVEQEQKFYFAKMAGFGWSLRIGEGVYETKNGIKQGFRYFTISGNYGSKTMENTDIGFNVSFKE
eukprot:704075_1